MKPQQCILNVARSYAHSFRDIRRNTERHNKSITKKSEHAIRDAIEQVFYAALAAEHPVLWGRMERRPGLIRNADRKALEQDRAFLVAQRGPDGFRVEDGVANDVMVDRLDAQQIGEGKNRRDAQGRQRQSSGHLVAAIENT